MIKRKTTDETVHMSIGCFPMSYFLCQIQFYYNTIFQFVKYKGDLT